MIPSPSRQTVGLDIRVEIHPNRILLVDPLLPSDTHLPEVFHIQINCVYHCQNHVLRRRLSLRGLFDQIRSSNHLQE